MNLSIENFIRNTVAGDAVTHHPTQHVLGFKYGAGVSHAAQVVGTGKTCDTTTNDGNLFAGIIARWMQFQFVFQAIVANKLFNRIDADIFLDLVAVATVFTRGRANSAHDGRKRIGIGHTVESVFLPHGTFRRLLNTAYNVQPAADVLA